MQLSTDIVLGNISVNTIRQLYVNQTPLTSEIERPLQWVSGL